MTRTLPKLPVSVIALLTSAFLCAGCGAEPKEWGDQLAEPRAAEWQCREHDGVRQMDTGRYASYSVVCMDGTAHTLEVCRYKGELHEAGTKLKSGRKVDC